MISVVQATAKVSITGNISLRSRPIACTCLTGLLGSHGALVPSECMARAGVGFGRSEGGAWEEGAWEGEAWEKECWTEELRIEKAWGEKQQAETQLKSRTQQQNWKAEIEIAPLMYLTTYLTRLL